MNSDRKSGPRFGTGKRHHFFKRHCRYVQCGFPMGCSSFADGHREVSQMSPGFGECMVLAVATLGQSSAKSFATLFHLLVDLYIPCLFAHPGKAVAANGAVLASSERQLLSLGLFLHISSPICLKKLNRKAGPFWVPDSGPKIGTVFRPLIVILIEGRKTVPILGPESGTQNGSAFRPQQCQKPAPLDSKNRPPWPTKMGHCPAMVRLAIPPREPKDSKHLLAPVVAASPFPARTRCALLSKF